MLIAVMTDVEAVMSQQQTHTFRAVNRPNPHFRQLGVSVAGSGLNVAVVSTRATQVDFCVIDPQSGSEERYHLLGPDHGIWHGYIEGLGVGTHYGFRAQGPWDPDAGLFFNYNKLLIDPYGRGLAGSVDICPEVYAHSVDEDLYPVSYPLEPSQSDSAPYNAHSVVIDTSFKLAPQPKVPLDETVIYELHVKGFTQNMPEVPPNLRGTYAGLAHPASVRYLKELGVTSVELLPVHAKSDEPFLVERGLTNYWGYSTLSFFSPEPSYASASARARGPQAVIDEFRGMVSILHEAGIEVILDVVYNHTCENGDTGPSLSFRGLDSPLYYRRTEGYPSHIIDTTGTGNTVNTDNPQVISLILDSLRYWVSNMGIDGFRFDLAATLGRFANGFTPMHPVLIGMGADPILREVKLIAEPWDVGLGGWQTGNFPDPFCEWNDRFRDTVRTFWLSDMRALAGGRGAGGSNEFATRLSGSQDVFGHGVGYLRGPSASVNFVTAHDGFTLADLTAFDHKHNLANLEENRDGSDNNNSWNHGLEGAIASPIIGVDPDVRDVTGIVEDIIPARQRSQRNLLATLLVSSGTPMLVAGDEFSRTQFGNNNAYCQDSPISWIDWDLSELQKDQLQTVRWLLALRRAHPALRPMAFFSGTDPHGDVIADLSWYSADGSPMRDDIWGSQESRVFQMLRSGSPYNDRDALVVFNGTTDDRDVVLSQGRGCPWVQVLDTAWGNPEDGGISSVFDATRLPASLDRKAPGDTISMDPFSMHIYLSAVESSPQG